jgi:hypothetical protein
MKIEKPVGLPNVVNTIKNNLLVNFGIKPVVDSEFDTQTFLNGAKQALEVISTHLANDNIEKIESLVTPEAYREIEQNYKNFTEQQKKELLVTIDDVIVSFIYSIKVKKDDSTNHTVEILVVYDCIRGFKDFLDKNKNTTIKFDLDKYFDRKYTCNYGFIRKYVKGMESEWIVNKLIHIKDKDVVDGII